MKKEVFRMERITYKSQNVTHLEDFNLNVLEGEIVGFIPIHSYGMKAFLEIIKFNEPLYDGYVYYNEILVNSWKGSLQSYNKITVIQNESCLVEGITVVDNIFVLRQKFRSEYIRPKVLRRQLEPFLQEIDVKISADTYVEKLSVFERIVVELLKAVIAGDKLIVLKEMETLLTYNELKKLHEIIRFYAAKGYSFIYISAHFEEMVEICSRVAFFVNGRIEKAMYTDKIDVDNLSAIAKDYTMLVQGYLENKREHQKNHKEKTHIVGEMRYQFENSDSVLDFKVKNSECLIVQCMDNEMYYELRNAIAKDAMNKESYIKIDEQLVNVHRDRKLGIIQEFATKSMLFPQLNYIDNLCFTLDTRMKHVWLRGNIRESIRLEYKDIIGEETFDTPVTELTEKEKIQLIYTRILLQKPKMVFCIQPFQGADLEHRMYIWTLLESLLQKGIGVVIFAVNLADALSIADRLIRIDVENNQYEFTSEQFGEIPSLAPWKYLYKNK